MVSIVSKDGWLRACGPGATCSFLNDNDPSSYRLVGSSVITPTLYASDGLVKDVNGHVIARYSSRLLLNCQGLFCIKGDCIEKLCHHPYTPSVQEDDTRCCNSDTTKKHQNDSTDGNHTEQQTVVVQEAFIIQTRSDSTWKQYPVSLPPPIRYKKRLSY